MPVVLLVPRLANGYRVGDKYQNPTEQEPLEPERLVHGRVFLVQYRYSGPHTKRKPEVQYAKAQECNQLHSKSRCDKTCATWSLSAVISVPVHAPTETNSREKLTPMPPKS